MLNGSTVAQAGHDTMDMSRSGRPLTSARVDMPNTGVQADFQSWLDQIVARNRRMLRHPNRMYTNDAKRSMREYVRAVVRWRVRASTPACWIAATNAIGAACAHHALQRREDLAVLTAFFDRHMDAQGVWKTTPNGVDAAMRGYPLLYLSEETHMPRYRQATDWLCDYFLTSYPRATDGSLRYLRNTEPVLVDSLGMVSPFLARYGALYGHSQAIDMAAHQIIQFVRQNVDADTRLPYHGYYADGPRRLGMHGWGRGTGWYMLGLVDTLADLPRQHPAHAPMVEAYQAAAASVKRFQRPDGHWGWAVPLRTGRCDSSATAFLGYSLMRGVQIGVLSDDYLEVIEAAIRGLMKVTGRDGILDGSQAECLGLGLYPATFGPRAWGQGMASAFASLYALHVRNRHGASSASV